MAINAVNGRIHYTGTAADLAGFTVLAPSLIGATFFATDTEILYIWNGTSWRPLAVSYGSFYGNEIAFSAAVNNSYTRVADTDCAQGQLLQVTYTDAGTTLTVTYAGKYLVNWYMSVESSVANTHVRGGVMVNSSTVLQNDGTNHIEETAANKQFALSGTAILSLAASAVVGVGVGSEDNITVLVDHVGLSLVMIGG